ncbi:MAG: hypothetical protein JSV84_16790 [Gemmatimonadota bacterium]|nr:MAG: hypothetical protein JSV84_16790 [Gemmatimonadota bacterium]
MSSVIIPYSDIYKHICDCESWLDEIGIRKSDRRRFNTVKDYILGVIESKDQKITKEDVVRNFEIIYDCHCYVDLYQYFKDRSITGEIAGKIRQACRMPSVLKEGDQLERNHFFELELAAYFSDWGVEVKGYEDVKIRIDKYNIHIECKRPVSPGKIGRNINKAYQKLKNEYYSDECRGIIALSLERITNPDGGLNGDSNLANTLQCFGNERQMYKQVRNFADAFYNKFKGTWSWISDSRLIWILLVYWFVATFDIDEYDHLAFIPVVVPLVHYENLQWEERHLIDQLADICSGRKS